MGIPFFHLVTRAGYTDYECLAPSQTVCVPCGFCLKAGVRGGGLLGCTGAPVARVFMLRGTRHAPLPNPLTVSDLAYLSKQVFAVRVRPWGKKDPNKEDRAKKEVARDLLALLSHPPAAPFAMQVAIVPTKWEKHLTHHTPLAERDGAYQILLLHPARAGQSKPSMMRRVTITRAFPTDTRDLARTLGILRAAAVSTGLSRFYIPTPADLYHASFDTAGALAQAGISEMRRHDLFDLTQEPVGTLAWALADWLTRPHVPRAPVGVESDLI